MTDASEAKQEPIPTLKSLFTFHRTDLLLLSFYPALTLLLFLFARHSLDYSEWYTCLDALYMVAMSESLFNSSFKDPFLQYSPKPLSMVYPPMYLYPALLKGLNMILKNYKVSQVILHLLTSSLSTFLFSRLLRAYGITKNVLLLSFVFSVYPFSHFIHSTTPNTDSLYLDAIILSFLFYRTNHPLLCSLTTILSSCVRVEGILLFITFIILYFVCKRPFFGVFFIAILAGRVYELNQHEGYWIGTIIPNCDSSVGKFPFQYFVSLKDSIGNLRQIHALFSIWIPELVATVLVLFQYPSIGVFCLLNFFLVTIQINEGLERVAIALDSISLVFGFAVFMENQLFRFSTIVTMIPYIVMCLFYTRGRINMTQRYRYVWKEFAQK